MRFGRILANVADFVRTERDFLRVIEPIAAAFQVLTLAVALDLLRVLRLDSWLGLWQVRYK